MTRPRSWAVLEVVVATAIVAAGLSVPSPAFMLGSAPWLAVIGVASIWWRGPSRTGFGDPSPFLRYVGWSALAGVAFQFVGTFALEPWIARLTGTGLPDVSTFRGIVGDEWALLYWVALSWSLAAVLEEVGYRGWVMTRLAELGWYSSGGWTVAALLSSALFGIAHLYQGPSGVIATGLSGLFFSGVYLVTRRRLWCAVVAHGMSNSVAFVMMYLGVYPGMRTPIA